MHKTAVNTLVLIALVLLFSTSAYATGLNASIRTNYPDGNYFFTDEPISVMLTMWDDNGDPLYADEAATNGLEIVELWLAGPKQDYFAVEPYSRRIIVDPENGYVCDHDLEGSRGEYMMYDQEYPDLLGTYSIIFKCQRQVDGNTITVYPRVDYLLGQNRPTSSQAARYLSCSTCHLSYGRHGNSNIDDCLLCHSNDRPWAFSSTMHNLHTSDNCLLCHRAGGGIGNYSATACYTCHTMPGSHSSYEDSDCSNCHSGGFSVYSRHDIDEPHQPSSFSLLSPPNETEIDCDSLVVSWTPSNDSDEGDMISYEI